MSSWEQIRLDQEKHGRIMENVFNLTDDGLLLTDSDGICLKINPAFTRISGLSEEQLIGKSHQVMVTESIVRNSCVLQVLEKKEKVTALCEYPITNRKALVTGTPMFSDAGGMELVITVARDVTELRDTEERLSEEQRLRQIYERQMETLRPQCPQGKAPTQCPWRAPLRLVIRFSLINGFYSNNMHNVIVQ